MPRTIPSVEPETLTAGMSWEWDKHLGDYTPADGWTLKYAFTGPSTVTTLTAAASSDNLYHEVRVLPDVTEDLKPGAYHVSGWTEDGTDRIEIYRSTMLVRVNFDTDIDARSADERVLEAIEAAIEGRASSTAKKVEINGRAIEHMAPEELFRWQGAYRARVWRQRNPGKLGIPVEVTFA